MDVLKNNWGKIIAGVLVLAVVFFAGKNWEREVQFSINGADYDYEERASDSMAMKTYAESSYEYYYDEPAFDAVSIDEIDFTDAMVIKNAYLSITVDDTLQAADQITNVAKSYEGYVSYSYTYEDYDGSTDGTVTFRVPADRFDEAMADVRELAEVISSESVNAEDVTEEYLDLDARLGTLYELEEQYLSVLDSATTVEEILMVHDYLQGVRAEVESLEGQMKYYENQSSYSTISVTLEEVVSVFEEASKWRPVQVIKEAFQSWIGMLQGGVNVAIWGVVFLWIVPVVWVLWRIFRKRK
ncbi:MAG: DUF4349 domain-containing protein [Patescibacteria group bacterium]|nr:DUF4349 domain-containing protein [Patescibacteria group bacterium]